MGRSHLVGPNPYATLVLLPGGRARGRTSRLQTPYQVRVPIRDGSSPASGAALACDFGVEGKPRPSPFTFSSSYGSHCT